MSSQSASCCSPARSAASAEEQLDPQQHAQDPDDECPWLDLSRAHLWDASAIAALDAIEAHYHRHDVELTITGLNDRSDRLHQTLSGQMAAAH